MKPLKIVMQRYHNFCEYYMYKTLSQHEFYVVDDGSPYYGRPMLPNMHLVQLNDVPWDEIDVGFAVTYDRVEMVNKMGKPCVMHFDQMPQDFEHPDKLQPLLENTVCHYWSNEEADAWDCGNYRVINRHPIDTEIFKGYNPTKKVAITIASRAFSGWTPDLKGFPILKQAYREVPIQVIARNDKDFDNARALESEEDMIEALTTHQLYFNCAWKLDRSPLEAMGCGMPVIAIRHRNNVYKDYFNEAHGNIVYADNAEDMIAKTKELLKDPDRCKAIGNAARETIKRIWNPDLARQSWNIAFLEAMEDKGVK